MSFSLFKKKKTFNIDNKYKYVARIDSRKISQTRSVNSHCFYMEVSNLFWTGVVICWFVHELVVDLYLQSQSLVLSWFGRDHMVDLQSQTLLIFTSSILAHEEVYCIQPTVTASRKKICFL